MSEPLLEHALKAYGRAVRILDPLRFQIWAERGITVPQVRVLFLLAEAGGASAGDLADWLHVAAPTVTGITDRLVRQGMIERRPDSSDRRIVRLALTAEGVQLTTEITDTSRAYLRKVFGRLSEERLRALAESLDELADVNALVNQQEALEV